MQAPRKRHRSKSAPDSSANKRPSALRKQSTSSSGSPSARIRDFLAGKKKDRASSTSSASKSVCKEVRKGDKFSKTKGSEKQKARKAEVEKEGARKAEVQKEKARKAEVEKEKARKAEVQKGKARKAEVEEKARKAEAEKEKARKAEVEEKARKAEVEKEKARKAEVEEKARKAEVEEKARKAEAEKEKARKAEAEKEKARKAEAEKEKTRKAEVEKEKTRKKEAEKKDQKAQVEKEKSRKLEVEKIEKEKARNASVEKQKAKLDEKSREKANVEKAHEKKKGKDKENDKEKKEPPIKFVPSQKSKVEHIFSTPSTKSSSSRERAEMHLQSLGALLQASDSDESSECQDTDMDGFLEDIEEAEKTKDVAETKEPNDEKNGDESEEENEEAPSETSSNSDMGEEEKEVSEPGSELDSDEEKEDEEELESEEEEAEESDEEVEEDKETKATKIAAPATATDGTGHALAEATKAAEKKCETLRNSTTNKREWDSFCRQLKSNNRIPCQVSEYAQTSANKTCLFGMWLDAEKDCTKCQLLLERTLKQQNEAEKGWCAMQGHEIQKKYKNNPERAEKIMKSRRDAGLWYPDEDFPDDPIEAWYFMRIGNSFKRKDITSESMTLKGSMDVDPALRQALTDADEGIMRPGALPKMQTNSANGNKQLLDALEKVTAAPKKKPKKEEEKSGAEEVKPQTWEEQAKDAMGELLLDAAKARTESIKLGNVPYAKELSDQLLEHASKLEGLYKSTEKAMQSNACEKDFKSLMAEIGEATAFTAKAKVASAALLKPPTKPKGKKDSGKKGKGRAKTKAAN